MFVGEMGCWLVVLDSHLYTRFAKRHSTAPLLAGGYRPIRSDEADNIEEEEEEEQADFESSGAENPVTKPLIESSTGRVHLRGWKVLLLAAPACCDITGTTLMNVGLLFVAASIYQMTRGALVLFVGLFSVLFLRRKLYLYQWLALVVVVLGVALVGLAGALFGSSQGHDPEDGVDAGMLFVRGPLATTQTPEGVAVLIGVLLIAAAQIFTASQFVLEEWILENYAMAPLNVVGWEGIFGFSVTVIAMVVLHLTVGSTEAGKNGYFDLAEGWREITTNRAIAVSSVLIMISIG
jgi:drug/metabolite transporter (DMT)-like permease